MLTCHQIVLSTLLSVYGWKSTVATRDPELFSILIEEVAEAHDEQYNSVKLWRKLGKLMHGQELKTEILEQFERLKSPFELDKLIEAIGILIPISPICPISRETVEIFGGVPHQLLASHQRSPLGSFALYLTTEYRHLTIHGISYLLQNIAKLPDELLGLTSPASLSQDESKITSKPTGKVMAKAVLGLLQRRDYYGAADIFYRYFDYDHWRFGSWYAIAALNVALCQSNGAAMLKEATMVFRDNHDEEGLHLAEKAQTLLTNLPEPNVDYLYPPRSHMSAFNNSSNQNVGNTDHSYNLKYWLRQCIQNAPENLSWEQLIAQCIQLYISFYKDPTHSSIERESIIPLVINQLAFELGRLHECANPNPTNLAHLQLPNAQRIWQAQVAACFQKASVPEIALCHQLYHQVPAHTVNLPGNLLSFTLSICLSLNLMGMGNQTVVARMVQDIAAECAQSTDQSTLGLFYLVEARLLLSCAGIDHDNSNGTALSPSKTADTTSDFNKALITAGGLLERAQKVFTILDDRDMLNEALYLQCILFHARGLFKKRDNIARRLQQLSATYP